MNTAENSLKTCTLNISSFDLEKTLDCGQAFRWKKQPDGSFVGAALSHAAKITQNNDEITIISDADEDFWREYFDVETDYMAIVSALSRVEQMKEPCRCCGKIRILKQDGWEALASFIISQNNNIKRISGIIERLCENFGDKAALGLYSFPPAERIAALTVEELAPLRCGFRARYLIDAAQKVASGEIDLQTLYTMPIDDARKTLKSIVGVGNKVADCALLFGFYRVECFPVDVWIRRAIEEFFPDGLPEDILPYAGIAQQFIFDYMRTREKAK